MSIKIYEELEQGSDEWFKARCGLLTASEVKHILTPKLKIANNDKTRQHVYEIAAQRMTNYVEPHYISDDMLRGHTDEILAREVYSEHKKPVREVGFVVNDNLGFKIGASPDGLVGSDGLIECKSRRQKYQIQTIADLSVPEEYVLQIQTLLLVTEREWCDFISYSGGMHMVIVRCYPNDEVQEAIVEAAIQFENKVADVIRCYENNIKEHKENLIPTERREEGDIVV